LLLGQKVLYPRPKGEKSEKSEETLHFPLLGGEGGNIYVRVSSIPPGKKKNDDLLRDPEEKGKNSYDGNKGDALAWREEVSGARSAKEKKPTAAE